jgi:hypothetical protein
MASGSGVVTPGKYRAFDSAASGFLALRFGGKTDR